MKKRKRAKDSRAPKPTVRARSKKRRAEDDVQSSAMPVLASSSLSAKRRAKVVTPPKMSVPASSRGRADSPLSTTPRVRGPASPTSAVTPAQVPVAPISPLPGLIADPDVISALRMYSRRRMDAVLAEGTLTRQIGRIVARYLNKTEVTTKEVHAYESSEALQPLIQARQAPRAWRAREEKTLVRLVEQLPVYHAFWKPVPGLGALGLAQIIGEAGDLSNYANPAKLWRRFGLHVGNGKAFATWRSQGGLSAKDWEAAGYSPRRRSLIFNVTDSMLKQRANPYRVLVAERKEVERKKAAQEGLIVASATDIPQGQREKYRSLAHIKARAERYVSKRLLRDLWRAWRDANPRVASVAGSGS